MKATKGQKIITNKRVTFGSVYGLIEIPQGAELTVLSRMDSDDGILTEELFKYKGVMGETSFPYGVWDKDYFIAR